MYAQSIVRLAYGIPKMAAIYRNGTQSDKSQQDVRPGDALVHDQYSASALPVQAPIMLNTAYSVRNVHQTYRNVMDATSPDLPIEVELPKWTSQMTESAQDRMKTLAILYKSAEMSGNLQAMRAAYDEALVIRKMRYATVKEQR